MKKLLLALLLLPTILLAGPNRRIITLSSTNNINFAEDFNAEYIAKKQIEASVKCLSNIGKDFYVTIYSPGGSISAGLLFFDTLKALPCNFHTITIFAASMGYQMVQNLGKRYILPSGRLMSHRASVGNLSGEIDGELDSVLDNIKRMVREMEAIASHRVGLTLRAYRELIRDELWLTGKEAVEKGHADEVALVKCDKSLSGTSYRNVNTLFGQVKLGFSDCPIIIAPVSIGANNIRSILEYKRLSTNIINNIKTSL